MDQKEMAKLGGHARAAALTEERKHQIARKAADARWAGHVKKKPRKPVKLTSCTHEGT
jgi:hypothetical protein